MSATMPLSSINTLPMRKLAETMKDMEARGDHTSPR
jgi:hypothetical protein